jgi:hypothetical protein
MTPDDMNTALAIYQYRRPPLTSAYGQRDPRQVAIMNAVERLGVDTEPYDAANWDSHKKGTLAFGTGQQGNQIRFVGTAMRHMETLNELAKRLDNEGPKALNSISNILKTQFGAPEANSLEAARNIIAAEIVKAVNASGGGVKERLEAAGHLDPSLTPTQIADLTETYTKLLNGQLEGFRQQWQRVPGNKGKDFDAAFSIPKKLTGGAAEAPAGDDDFVKRAKEAGYSDEDIQKYLKGKKDAPKP